MTAFTTVKIRVAGAVICDQHVALIHRAHDGADQYTLPGGNVEPGEPLLHALYRELREELDLHPNSGTPPHLVAVQDQMLTRPGPTPPPRKLHLVFRLDLHPADRPDLPAVEHDDLTTGAIVWTPLTDLAALHLYPDAHHALATHPPRHATARLLPPLTDSTYRWI